MGRLKTGGATCWFCKEWFLPPKYRVRFRIDHVDRLACVGCAQIEKNKLEGRLAKEGKEVRGVSDKSTHTLIIFTDAVDYVPKDLLLDPKETLLTPKKNPEMFKSSQEVKKINTKMSPPRVTSSTALSPSLLSAMVREKEVR